VFFDGRLHRADRDPNVLRRYPVRLMKVSWHLHRLGCELSLGLERAVEESLDVVDDAFRRSPAVRDLFLDICRSWGRVALTFSELPAPGRLGRTLRRSAGPTAPGRSDASPTSRPDRPSLLRRRPLATLPPAQLPTAAVGPGVLTGWQARILHELYARTLARLTGGRVAKPNRTQLAARLWETLGGDVPMADVRAHLAMVQDRYLATTSVQRMAAHLRLVARLESAPVATELFHHPDLGSSDLVVVTPDVPGLFALIAGTLAAHGVNI